MENYPEISFIFSDKKICLECLVFIKFITFKKMDVRKVKR